METSWDGFKNQRAAVTFTEDVVLSNLTHQSSEGSVTHGGETEAGWRFKARNSKAGVEYRTF